MPCIKLPTLPIPTLPPGFSFGPPPLPPLPSLPGLCCKLPPFATPPLLPPIPPVVFNPAVIAIINGAIQAIQAFEDQLQVPCPRE